MKSVVFALFAALATPLAAQDVVILGEVHDNPHHHAEQARRVADLAPAAIVFEMLTEDQADRVKPDLRGDQAALADALEWEASGWPDFAMYYPIFAAAPQARIYGGAVPRGDARVAMEQGVAAYFGAEAGLYGLDIPLQADEQSEREADQLSAHCDALPDSMLPVMVDIQRLRDATLARATVQALDETGGPVAVITGNGHARRDRGVPVYLERVKPDLDLHVLGQLEEGAISPGLYDEAVTAPGIERDDPCAAFAK